jgi:hypothetical protein
LAVAVAVGRREALHQLAHQVRHRTLLADATMSSLVLAHAVYDSFERRQALLRRAFSLRFGTKISNFIILIYSNHQGGIAVL